MDQPMSFKDRVQEFVRQNASLLLALGFLFLLIQDIFGTHGLLVMRRSQREAAQVRADIERLNQENQGLQQRIQALRNDPRAIERIAREEMGLARPGEMIFRLPGKGQTPAPDGASPRSIPKK